MSTPIISYKNHRFPPSIIAHAVWLYPDLHVILFIVATGFLLK